ncbi:MAG TPA: TIGR03560 family F420-dependent LLM class oxidoreductase [Acidimicrobiales bacterium]|nr:TIGR03560 family F420-dependent LLM class oxidoreductase [Acidimicrobiales bacterium]
MRFSLWPTTMQSWPDLQTEAAHAAATGWDGVWVADHFMPSAEPVDQPMLECWSVLAALAVTVPGIRLGSLVTGNTYRHPAVLANAAATVDQLSGGRVVLGLGAGWQQNEHAAYGLDLYEAAERLSRLDEACAVLRLLFDESRASFAGRYFTLVDAPMEPKPAQAHLPLLIGGGGERVTLRIAARWADEWNVWGTPEILAAKGAILDRHCAQVGRDPGAIGRCAQVLVDLDGSAAGRESRVPTVSGSVAELEDLLGRYEAAGVGEFVLPDWNLGTGARRLDAIDRFLTEVAAPFRPPEAPAPGPGEPRAGARRSS